MMKTPLLRTKALSVNFGGLNVLKGVDISIGNDSITALIGPNGAGKTTLFNMISGFVPATTGTIHFKNKVIGGAPPHVIARLGIIRTFQDVRIFRHATVMENIFLSLRKHHMESFINATLFRKRIAQDTVRLRSEALALLKDVELDSYADEPAANLSYGQAKLLEITRARAMNPALLLLDEPASGLNPIMIDKVKRLLLDMTQQGICIFLVEHNMPFVFDIADKIIVFDKGCKISEGTSEEIRADKGVISAYLGGSHVVAKIDL